MASKQFNAKKPLCENLRSYFKEYCSSSSIHGIKYFGESRSYWERGWWLVVFLMCLSCCAYFITLVYIKWEDSPVIVSLATRETPIYEIPFPAVTICPETKSVKERFSLSDTLAKVFDDKNLTDEEINGIFYMDLLCDVDLLPSFSDPKLRSATFNSSYYNDTFFTFMYNVTPNILDLMLSCHWMNKYYSCEELFDLIVTEEGVCATFNMLDHTDIYRENVVRQEIPMSTRNIFRKTTWTMDRGYAHGEDVNTYPRRALLSGAKNALNIVFREFNVNLDHMCKTSLQGYKVTLHSPGRIPRPTQHYFRLPLNEVVISTIKPTMISTSKAVEVFKPEKRECYFANEKYLSYFKVYTQRNCQLECLANFTLEWCLCVSFFMPRLNGTAICGFQNKECMKQAEEVLDMGFLTNVMGIKHNKKNASYQMEETKGCKCLPLCSDLSYEVGTSSSAWNWKPFIESLMSSRKINISADEMESEISFSKLDIYFQNNQFTAMKRHELYGPTDFLGNFGGLLGLFTGFSILSLMELIYFLTVRIICNLKLYGNWSGHEKDVEKNL